MTIDPMGMAQHRANVRGQDRDKRGHGAATDRASVVAYCKATAERQRCTAATAVRTSTEPRGYTLADHDLAETKRHDAEVLRKLAADKLVPEQRRLVECAAEELEHEAEAIVPLKYSRKTWQ